MAGALLCLPPYSTRGAGRGRHRSTSGPAPVRSWMPVFVPAIISSFTKILVDDIRVGTQKYVPRNTALVQ